MSRASGKARRWPDLLIGLLVLLLLGGFAFLLIGQRPQPVAQTPTPTPTPTTPAASAPDSEPVTIPTAPGSGTTEENDTTTATPPASSGENPATSPPAATTPPAPDSAGTPAEPPQANAPSTSATPEPGGSSTSPGTQEGGEGTTATTEIPVVPAAPIEEAPSASATAPNAADGEPADTPATSTPPAATPATPPRSAAPVATSEQRTPLRSDYRVSLGSFATRRTAERLTQGVSDLGYTVYPIDLGDQVVAQIGPFADEATARRALADIRRAYPGAVLYPPRGRSLRGDTTEETPPPASTPAAPDSARPSTPAPASAANAPAPATPAPPEALPAPAPTTPTPPAAPTTTEPKASVPAAPGGPVYLQLGAFDRAESAQNLVARLRSEGYAPTVSAPDGRKVTVLVGPFSGPALTSAETNLASRGHEFFRVR